MDLVVSRRSCGGSCSWCEAGPWADDVALVWEPLVVSVPDGQPVLLAAHHWNILVRGFSHLPGNFPGLWVVWLSDSGRWSSRGCVPQSAVTLLKKGKRRTTKKKKRGRKDIAGKFLCGQYYLNITELTENYRSDFFFYIYIPETSLLSRMFFVRDF